MTICQVSTVDGSPRLERQVQKLTIQMHHQCPTLTAAGYFTLGRNMILKVISIFFILSLIFCFVPLQKFSLIIPNVLKWMSCTIFCRLLVWRWHFLSSWLSLKKYDRVSRWLHEINLREREKHEKVHFFFKRT